MEGLLAGDLDAVSSPEQRFLEEVMNGGAVNKQDDNPPLTFTSILERNDDDEQPAAERPIGEVQPRKKIRYDGLGREIPDLGDQDQPAKGSSSRSFTSAAVGSNPRVPPPHAGLEPLKRPRGRPPKGKIWHEKRGWVDEGLGFGPVRSAVDPKEW